MIVIEKSKIIIICNHYDNGKNNKLDIQFVCCYCQLLGLSLARVVGWFQSVFLSSFLSVDAVRMGSN